MRQTLTEQQTAFFTKNGYIEFENVLDTDPLFAAAKATLDKRLKSTSPEALYTVGRDLWRSDPTLQTFLTNKLAPLIRALTRKPRLHLACDQWIPEGFSRKKQGLCSDLFSIQGLAIGALISERSTLPPKRSPLGLLPLPAHSGNVLFFRTNLILDWPRIDKIAPNLYLAVYALPNAVYVENLKDPATNALKSLGYGFGDPLRNEHHPFVS